MALLGLDTQGFLLWIGRMAGSTEGSEWRADEKGWKLRLLRRLSVLLRRAAAAE